MSSSAVPYKRTPPSWCKATAPEVSSLFVQHLLAFEQQ
jgi:hypothetical protein